MKRILLLVLLLLPLSARAGDELLEVRIACKRSPEEVIRYVAPLLIRMGGYVSASSVELGSLTVVVPYRDIAMYAPLTIQVASDGDTVHISAYYLKVDNGSKNQIMVPAKPEQIAPILDALRQWANSTAKVEH